MDFAALKGDFGFSYGVQDLVAVSVLILVALAVAVFVIARHARN